MSFLSDFETAVIKDAKTIEAELLVIAVDIKPLVIASAEELATIALNAVATQAPLVLSGQEKFSAAVSTVITGLGANGKSIGVSVAEAAVQSAYNTISALINKTS